MKSLFKRIKDNNIEIMLVIESVLFIVTFVYLMIFILNFTNNENVSFTPDTILDVFVAITSLLMSLVLSSLTVYHNIKIQRNNVQMQKFQQAQFISMVSAKDISVKLDPKLKMDNPEYFIDVTNKAMEESARCDIAITFENFSDYPVVQMNIHMDNDNEKHESNGMVPYLEHQVYIAPHSIATYHILAPLRSFVERDSYICKIEIDYINIFDYSTTAMINIPDFKKKEYSYRLKKVNDIKPTR